MLARPVATRRLRGWLTRVVTTEVLRQWGRQQVLGWQAGLGPDSGALRNFTGVDSPYEPPEHADLVLPTPQQGPEGLARMVVDHLRNGGTLR